MMWLFLAALVVSLAGLGACALMWDVWRRAILMERERMTFLASYEQLWKSNVKALADMDADWQRKFARLEAGQLGELTRRRAQG